ncbi:MAG: hypothetical protein OQL18_11575, partial [Deltaproteobacteria bacterium]|nr:hypothetical protein [Deltaproteobacteria bacterium]
AFSGCGDLWTSTNFASGEELNKKEPVKPRTTKIISNRKRLRRCFLFCSGDVFQVAFIEQLLSAFVDKIYLNFECNKQPSPVNTCFCANQEKPKHQRTRN